MPSSTLGGTDELSARGASIASQSSLDGFTMGSPPRTALTRRTPHPSSRHLAVHRRALLITGISSSQAENAGSIPVTRSQVGGGSRFGVEVATAASIPSPITSHRFDTAWGRLSISSKANVGRRKDTGVRLTRWATRS